MAQQRLDEASITQVVDAVPECADTWKDDLSRLLKVCRIAADPGFEAELFEGLLDASQVAHFIVYNGNHLYLTVDEKHSFAALRLSIGLRGRKSAP